MSPLHSQSPAGAMIGVFTYEGTESTQQLEDSRIRAYEELIGRRVASVMWYGSWEDPFPTANCQLVRAHGSLPHYTWEFAWPTRDVNFSGDRRPGESSLDDVLSGMHDRYIDQFAGDARKWGGEVLIRFLHEFNGDWYAWSGSRNGGEGGGPEKVRRAWRYVVERCRAAGAANVRWMWCAHGPATDRREEPWNAIESYWPGADYVDWLGMDGYNWYPSDASGNPKPYTDSDGCFADLYAQLRSLARDKPIAVGEMGSGEFSYGEIDKAHWIAESFARMKSAYPAVELYTWFDIEKERDWRVSSSPQSLAAFRTAMADPYFLSEYRPRL